MNKPSKPWKELLQQRLAASEEEAIGYLNACLDENDPALLLAALRDVAEARGGISNDVQFEATQERILRFECVLAEARRQYTAANYQAMAEGYLLEIDRMRAEIRAYLSQVPAYAEAA